MGLRSRGEAWLLLALCGAVLIGCSDDGGGGPSAGPRECERGTSYSCRTTTGCGGRMYCTPEGTFTRCMCEEEPMAGSPAPRMDAGSTDAGSEAVTDSGSVADAAPVTDSGSDSVTDAGSDSGSATDAGSDSGSVADSGSDAALATDAASSDDAGNDDDAG